MHNMVHGVIGERVGGFEPDTPYTAHHLQSLAWVMSTLIESGVMGYELTQGRLAEADKVCGRPSHDGRRGGASRPCVGKCSCACVCVCVCVGGGGGKCSY